MENLYATGSQKRTLAFTYNLLIINTIEMGYFLAFLERWVTLPFWCDSFA